MNFILPETRFDGLNFFHGECMPISIVHGMVNCRRNVAKNPKKTRHVGSRSFKVIVFRTNRKGIYDFLAVVNPLTADSVKALHFAILT